MNRCKWVNDDPLYQQYHDNEWGVPEYDDQTLFEMINLEGAQAGLSWYVILKKRETYRIAFDGFDPVKISTYDETKKEELLQNPGIVRNKQKINAVITNAHAYLDLQKETSFSAFLWSFVGGNPVYTNGSVLPDMVETSEKMSKELKKRGFKFVGPTICYAFMQACGMIIDHDPNCFRYKKDAK